MLDAQVVEQEAGLEVVGAIQDDIGAAELLAEQQPLGVGGAEIGHQRTDADVGVDLGQPGLGGFGLGQTGLGVGGVEEDLTLEIARFDQVAVEDGQAADPRTAQLVGDDAAQRAAADDGGVGGQQAALAVGPDAGQDGLAGVLGQVGEGGRGRGFHGEP